MNERFTYQFNQTVFLEEEVTKILKFTNVLIGIPLHLTMHSGVLTLFI